MKYANSDLMNCTTSSAWNCQGKKPYWNRNKGKSMSIVMG